jgi:hypothetical protein
MRGLCASVYTATQRSLPRPCAAPCCCGTCSSYNAGAQLGRTAGPWGAGRHVLWRRKRDGAAPTIQLLHRTTPECVGDHGQGALQHCSADMESPSRSKLGGGFLKAPLVRVRAWARDCGVEVWEDGAAFNAASDRMLWFLRPCPRIGHAPPPHVFPPLACVCICEVVWAEGGGCEGVGRGWGAIH